MIKGSKMTIEQIERLSKGSFGQIVGIRGKKLSEEHKVVRCSGRG